MADGNYQFFVTGRNNALLSIDAFQDGVDVNGDPLVRLITKQDNVFTDLVNSIKTAVEGTLAVIPNTSISIDSSSITVGTTATTIIDVNCLGKETLGCVISNTGGTAFNNFQVSVRYNADQGFYNPITFANADFDTNVGRQTGNVLVPIQASSGIGNPSASPNPRLLGAGVNGWLEMRVTPYESVRLTATVASGSTTARIRGIVQ